MIDRILALPMAAAAYLLIAPLDPASFYFGLVTERIAPFGETGKMSLMGGSLFFCIAPMMYVPEARGFHEKSNTLEKSLCIVAIAGTIFGSILATFYVLRPEWVHDTLVFIASTTTARLSMGTVGTVLALSALFAGTGLLRKTP